MNGWLNFVYERRPREGREVYETMQDLFGYRWHFCYFTNLMHPGEKYHNVYIELPWEQKYELALRCVNRTWRTKPKYVREQIATALAQGKGDLSMLQCFQVSIVKNGSKWEYQYCSSSLSGPNYDYCKRMYLRSL